MKNKNENQGAVFYNCVTREQVKLIVPVLQSWADGGDIEFLAPTGEWRLKTDNSGLLFCLNPAIYRKAPKSPKMRYVPFETAEEVKSCEGKLIMYKNGCIWEIDSGVYVYADKLHFNLKLTEAVLPTGEAFREYRFYEPGKDFKQMKLVGKLIKE